jgi:hypothetical protein
VSCIDHGQPDEEAEKLPGDGGRVLGSEPVTPVSSAS